MNIEEIDVESDGLITKVKVECQIKYDIVDGKKEEYLFFSLDSLKRLYNVGDSVYIDNNRTTNFKDVSKKI